MASTSSASLATAAAEPEDAEAFVANLVAELGLEEESGGSGTLGTSAKFNLISVCEQAFGKPVPNYVLKDLESSADVAKYFSEPAEIGLRNRDKPLFHEIDMENLPPNLTIIT